MKPSIGRIIHVRINDSTHWPGVPRWRSAVITAVWGDECVNAVITLDGKNDGDIDLTALGNAPREGFQAWITSTTLGDGVAQWRWPPRV